MLQVKSLDVVGTPRRGVHHEPVTNAHEQGTENLGGG